MLWIEMNTLFLEEVEDRPAEIVPRNTIGCWRPEF